MQMADHEFNNLDYYIDIDNQDLGWRCSLDLGLEDQFKQFLTVHLNNHLSADWVSPLKDYVADYEVDYEYVSRRVNIDLDISKVKKSKKTL